MDIKEALARKHKDEDSGRHPWEVARAEVVSRLLDTAASCTCSPGQAILDIGCGDAFIARRLAGIYPQSRLIGIDTALDPRMRREILDRAAAPNLEIYQSLNQIPLDIGYVDIVLLLDILEHVADDAAFLNELASNTVIKEKAVFLITVPAFQCLSSSHDRYLNHFRRYNHKQLLAAARKSAIKPLQYGYFFSSGLFLRFFQKIMEKFNIIPPETETAVSNWNGGNLSNRLMTRILIHDFRVSQLLREIGLLLPGLSCYLIGQKQ